MKPRIAASFVNAAQAAALACVATVAAGPAAHAQFGPIFGTFRPGPGDQQIVGERTRALLDGPADQRMSAWENPRTGNHGTIALMQELTRGGRQCRQVEYRIQRRASDQAEVVILLWCKSREGRWQIYG